MLLHEEGSNQLEANSPPMVGSQHHKGSNLIVWWLHQIIVSQQLQP